MAHIWKLEVTLENLAPALQAGPEFRLELRSPDLVVTRLPGSLWPLHIFLTSTRRRMSEGSPGIRQKQSTTTLTLEALGSCLRISSG